MASAAFPFKVVAASADAEDIRWVSCRGGAAGEELSFAEAALAGWANDGGMLMPTKIPQVSTAELNSWRGLAYPDLCAAVLGRWVPTSAIAPAVLRACVGRACDRFGLAEVLRLAPLALTPAPSGAELNVLELFHGPTLAFKDLGMCVLVEVLQHLLEQRGERRTLIVGTSGDTGPSALEAAKGMSRLDVVVLYPRGRVSRVQEGQMLAAGKGTAQAETGKEEGNGWVIGVDGTSDDLDVPCEAALKDPSFNLRHKLGTVNSVNVVRMLAQTVHFFWASLRVSHHSGGEKSESNSSPCSFSIPSGAAGHLVAGVRKFHNDFHVFFFDAF
jgi:threonine synthase